MLKDRSGLHSSSVRRSFEVTEPVGVMVVVAVVVLMLLLSFVKLSFEEVVLPVLLEMVGWVSKKAFMLLMLSFWLILMSALRSPWAIV